MHMQSERRMRVVVGRTGIIEPERMKCAENTVWRVCRCGSKGQFLAARLFDTPCPVSNSTVFNEKSLFFSFLTPLQTGENSVKQGTRQQQIWQAAGAIFKSNGLGNEFFEFTGHSPSTEDSCVSSSAADSAPRTFGPKKNAATPSLAAKMRNRRWKNLVNVTRFRSKRTMNHEVQYLACKTTDYGYEILDRRTVSLR